MIIGQVQGQVGPRRQVGQSVPGQPFVVHDETADGGGIHDVPAGPGGGGQFLFLQGAPFQHAIHAGHEEEYQPVEFGEQAAVIGFKPAVDVGAPACAVPRPG